MSCSAILNDYDGVQHDYTRKKGLVWQHIFLPSSAPSEWEDRRVLWNAVEEAEKTKDSRLAREFVVALPIELNPNEQIEMVSDFVREQFVSEGMCADAAIHDTDGHNPHAHIMLTVRPLDKNGKWQYKTEKEYLCIRDGEERGFTAAEFKTAQKEGWEKQYLYYVNKKKKAYLPPSAAEGLERADKHPKSAKFGRQNPIAARWNSEDQLLLWRKAWADVTNRYLERYGHDTRIDHRSNAERGLTDQPTIHEGVTARAMEAKGITANRCELNRKIKADNALLRELRATVRKLTTSAKKTIPAIAEAMETVRQTVLIFCYQLGHVRIGQQKLRNYISELQSESNRYSSIVKQINEKRKERKDLLAEQKALPFWNIPQKKELTARISELTELLEELRSEKAAALDYLQCTDSGDISRARKEITKSKAILKKLDTEEQQYATELTAALRQYSELQEQAAEIDSLALYEARQAIRPEMEKGAVCKIQNLYGNAYDLSILRDSKRETANLLGEKAESRSIRERLRQAKQESVQQQMQQTRKTKNRDWER